MIQFVQMAKAAITLARVSKTAAELKVIFTKEILLLRAITGGCPYIPTVLPSNEQPTTSGC